MKAESFCYWLQGYFEILDADRPRTESEKPLTPLQVVMIKRHLAMVFKHDIDPKLGTPEHVAKLQSIHDRLDMIESAPVQVIDPNPRYTC
jgi:hypothetical protein